MKQEEIDSVLQVLENPVRRKIIKRLSQEPSYALQLSKELGLGQALVAKHLAIMERSGLVTSSSESSPSGPARRRYSLAKNITITMDLASNVFTERAIAFTQTIEEKGTSERADLIWRRLQTALEATGDDRATLAKISGILNELDREIGGVEHERLALIKMRNRLMAEVSRIAARQDGAEKKRVLFHMLDEHDTKVESISSSLNLRELVVRSILDELERDLLS